MSTAAWATLALAITVVGLLWDAVRQRRNVRRMWARIEFQGRSMDMHYETLELHADAIDGTRDRVRKLEMRLDRTQAQVRDQGWGDSRLLTRFDWRKPEDD